MYERVLKDLKEVAKDVNGDIIGLGDQRYVVITPNSVKISREKIGGAAETCTGLSRVPAQSATRR